MNRCWKGLILILLLISLLTTWIQLEQVRRWMNQGGRFTDMEGFELCETMRIIALHSIGFQQSGLELPNCDKYLKSAESKQKALSLK